MIKELRDLWVFRVGICGEGVVAFATPQTANNPNPISRNSHRLSRQKFFARSGSHDHHSLLKTYLRIVGPYPSLQEPLSLKLGDTSTNSRRRNPSLPCDPLQVPRAVLPHGLLD